MEASDLGVTMMDCEVRATAEGICRLGNCITTVIGVRTTHDPDMHMQGGCCVRTLRHFSQLEFEPLYMEMSLKIQTAIRNCTEV